LRTGVLGVLGGVLGILAAIAAGLGLVLVLRPGSAPLPGPGCVLAGVLAGVLACDALAGGVLAGGVLTSTGLVGGEPRFHLGDALEHLELEPPPPAIAQLLIGRGELDLLGV